MDDRHTISSPRVVSANPPKLSWEVDIYRANVPEPIDTILIDDSTLPPRKRKNKIVWRLPTEVGKMPSFGTDEKRRIMDLYKERKRNRRKMRRDSTTDEKEKEKPGKDEVVDLEKKRREIEERVREAKLKVEKEEKERLLLEEIKRETEERAKLEEIEKERARLEREKAKDKEIAAMKEEEERLRLKEQKERDRLKKENEENKRLLKLKQEKEEKIRIQKQKKKDEKKIKSRKDEQLHWIKPEKEVDSPPKQEPQEHPPNDEQSENSPPSPTQTNNNDGISSPPSFPPTSKHILIPATPSPTILAAKKFVQLYYPYLTHGLTTPLAHYYTPTAQKSVSVGGAHSVVTGHSSILSQISSLSGSIFSIVGVVAQDANGGAHILVTGVCNTQGVERAFAHSVGLMKSFEDETWVGFQIQNDALSLLKDMIPGPPPVSGTGPSVAVERGASAREDRACNVIPPPGLFG
mmetsp:Transcript_24176/g.29306  ORF Transcript_24176/g.29306 Transcript_24176/m.29306 type:complete len:464 (+) Transcript_24176:71-1462(+)